MITLKQAAAWCGGRVLPEYEDVRFSGARADSRQLVPGQLFVALQGARDGHDFIPCAMERGAAAALGERQLPGVPMIVAEDSLAALGKIARGWRETLSTKVVGVTGSVGKTTTKEMIAAVLETGFVTGKTQKNFNNNIGLPMTVLDLGPATEAAVIEMGMNHFGEISYLTQIARPQLAVITNIGTMHIENLGSREGICRAKLEILEGMPADGAVILNGDEPLLRRAKTGRPTVFFGFGPDCDLRAVELAQDEAETRFVAEGLGERFALRLPVEGRHNVYNALAAAAVGLTLGLTPAQIARGLRDFRNTGERQNIYEKNGCTVISDCYNAGPESMAAALSILERRPGRRIAVLGDMLELGEHGPAAHERVGRLAAESAELVWTYGPLSALTAAAAGEKGRHFDTHAALIEALRAELRPGDVLLFKGSHGMHMEKVLEGVFA